MIEQTHTEPLSEAGLYAGFDAVSRQIILYWKSKIIDVGDDTKTLETIEDLNQRLIHENAIIFFDHHYAFDAIPVGLILGELLKYVTHSLVPYAVHLNMGVDPEGHPSLRYWVRTTAFQWLIDNFQKENPNVIILPVAREFEMTNPTLKNILDSEFSGINVKYLKLFTQLFQHHSSGLVCFLSPMAGIALPGKPVLHPQIYRSMVIAQRKNGAPLPFYFVGAYPRWMTRYQYIAPLLTKHTFAARGPFYLPDGDYEASTQIVSDHLYQMRDAVGFEAPDYTLIEHK